MNIETLNTLLVPILIAVAVILAVSLVALFAVRGVRSQKLRQKFGPEYDYALEKEGDRRAAEEALAERAKRVSKLEIHELNEDEKVRYQNDWVEIQARFVDNPLKSVEDATRLITEVMIARGFPVTDFEQRAADLSVLYPEFVSNYRNAYEIAVESQHNGASTEKLRQAMVYYRSMFDELLGTVTVEKVEEKEVVAP